MWNEHLHRRDLCGALGRHRGVLDPVTVIIPREIGKVFSYVLPPSRVIMLEAPPPRWVQRLYRGVRTGNRNKVVIGGAQRRVKFNRVSRRIRGTEEVQRVGPDIVLFNFLFIYIFLIAGSVNANGWLSTSYLYRQDQDQDPSREESTVESTGAGQLGEQQDNYHILFLFSYDKTCKETGYLVNKLFFY